VNRYHTDPFGRTLAAPTVTRRTILKGIGTAATLAAWGASATSAQGQPAAPTPVTGHPRLWLTEADLPRLPG